MPQLNYDVNGVLGTANNTLELTATETNRVIVANDSGSAARITVAAEAGLTPVNGSAGDTISFNLDRGEYVILQYLAGAAGTDREITVTGETTHGTSAARIKGGFNAGNTDPEYGFSQTGFPEIDLGSVFFGIVRDD
jgi:redox-sensitive bicupin YhaK (pirin superfamily)